MRNGTKVVFTLAVLSLVATAGHAALTPYNQDFEGLVQSDADALTNDGWLVFGNVSDPQGGYLYGYGTFPAPNHSLAFCQITAGEGGAEQGAQQLVVFSDYENIDHSFGNIIESNVFQERTVEAQDIGQAWVFEFQAKLGNITGGSTALAFIKTLDPGADYALTNFISVDMTSIPTTWSSYTLGISIDSTLEDQILQFGFLCEATNYEGSGIYYDNLVFRELTVDVPDASAASGAALRQNYPNPFNPSTTIGFALDRPGPADVSVFDVAGRRITTLYSGELGAGEHQVTWNGRTDGGSSAAAGQYWYVLTTATGKESRRMVLVK